MPAGSCMPVPGLPVLSCMFVSQAWLRHFRVGGSRRLLRSRWKFPNAYADRLPHRLFRGLLGRQCAAASMASVALRPLVWMWLSPCRHLHEPLRPLVAGTTVRQRDSKSEGSGAFARRTREFRSREWENGVSSGGGHWFRGTGSAASCKLYWTVRCLPTSVDGLTATSRY